MSAASWSWTVARPEDSRNGLSRHHKKIAGKIGRKEAKRLRAQERRDRSIFFGLGMFGLIGWSVSVPTLIGIAVGVWLDAHYPARISWTLSLLVAGITLGCINALYWLEKEMREEEDDNG